MVNGRNRSTPSFVNGQWVASAKRPKLRPFNDEERTKLSSMIYRRSLVQERTV